jgi:trimeric autotransporter adhesin
LQHCPPTILSFTIGAPLTSLFTGATEQLTATVQFSNGAIMDVTNTARWQSSNPAAATIGASGLLTPAGTGSTTITATFEGVTATQSIATATTMSQLQALPSLATDGSGNYMVQLSFTNTGNITLSNIGLTSAQLGSTTGPLPGSIPSLAPGATQVISVTFPASAGAPKTGALLRIAAAYSLSIPDGPAQQSSLSASFRVSLP